MTFSATLHAVGNRGTPPVAFLTDLVDWARGEDDSVFAPNATPVDIFTLIKPQLGTPAGKDGAGTPVFHWDSLLHRKAAMLETMRVHAGFESSWHWNEGVDRNNPSSMRNVYGQETGAWQVSFDSTALGHGVMMAYARAHGIDTPERFIPEMKANRTLAMSYYGRLVRVNIAWAGPLARHEVNPFLRRDAMAEFESLLK